MVALSTIHASNALISSTLPAGLIAIFVGGTSGIGEITLKKFAQYTRQPRAYIIGRSQQAADRIVAECSALNPAGQFIFIKADVSLIRVVDQVCAEIKSKEKALNLLFLTPGVARFDRSQTSEGVHLLAALNYYSRLRFITLLLPLLNAASSRLRRVVSVGGGGYEGALDDSDFPAMREKPDLRAHLTSLVTFGLEAAARTAPRVSFVHDYPGTVKTSLRTDWSDEIFQLLTFTPLDECGERQLYVAMSARYPSAAETMEGGEGQGVPLGDGVHVAVGTTGEVGSGMYSIGVDCESASPATLKTLAEMREQAMVDKVWEHTEGEYKRITEQTPVS
ncbi:hypothetical protein BX600DRAFT_438066 [Xylariales sp. PMI_506]|nr:hypothetical protein BX600DRAFT_438066 [Xylariales sp. PMI_506]